MTNHPSPADREYWKGAACAIIGINPSTEYGKLICAQFDVLMDRLDALYADCKNWQSKALAYETIIERMTNTMEDYDVQCPDCEGTMTRNEMQEGLCIDCARRLS